MQYAHNFQRTCLTFFFLDTIILGNWKGCTRQRRSFGNGRLVSRIETAFLASASILIVRSVFPGHSLLASPIAISSYILIKFPTPKVTLVLTTEPTDPYNIWSRISPLWSRVYLLLAVCSLFPFLSARVCSALAVYSTNSAMSGDTVGMPPDLCCTCSRVGALRDLRVSLR